jgi:uncharacterized protein (TIGR01777 family)
MRVIVIGGTGFIGSALCRELLAAGHAPVVLSRDPQRALSRLGAGIEAVRWEPGQGGDWRQTVAGADAVINLAGESIAAGRWTAAQKAAIRDSRVASTRSLVAAIEQAERRPRILLNASASGYYGPRGDEPVTEEESPGDDFLARVCREWEAEARAAEALGVRVALVRTGVVLGRGGGALARLLPSFKLFVGGPLGSGRQGFPWVHLADVVGIYLWALQDEAATGPLNATGPEAITNKQFCRVLGRVLGRPCWAPVPGFALRLLLGEMAEPLLLQGQKVLPARTERLGYRFKFPTAEAALRDVLR